MCRWDELAFCGVGACFLFLKTFEVEHWEEGNKLHWLEGIQKRK